MEYPVPPQATAVELGTGTWFEKPWQQSDHSTLSQKVSAEGVFKVANKTPSPWRARGSAPVQETRQQTWLSPREGPRDSLGKVSVQPKHSKGWRWKTPLRSSSFPIQRVSSRDRGRECPPHPGLLTSCSHFQTTSLHPTSRPRMLCACWLLFPCWLGITTGIGALSSKGRCWRCHHSKPGGFGVPGEQH